MVSKAQRHRSSTLKRGDESRHTAYEMQAASQCSSTGAVMTNLSRFKPRLDEEGQLLARTAAYTLVQYVYEHMPAEEVKSRILGPAGGDQVSP